VDERLSIRERLGALSRRELVALVAVAGVVVAGAGLWYARSLPKPVEVRAAEPPGGGSRPPPVAASASPSPRPSVLFVHVAGLVRRPGVYRFRQGQRVVDAVNAAGGPTKKGDPDLLNLAALLTDGEQVLVPARGSTVVPPPGEGGTTGATRSTGAPVNVNTGSESELESLPGVGPVLAAAIIAYRTEHGPFPTVDALDDVSGIGPATLENLRPLVTV
jgi:competence protein ComEA